MTQPLLITGGSGFIGSNLIRQLLQSGYAVTNLDKLTYAGNPANLADVADNPDYAFVQGDIGNKVLITGLLDTYQPQAILNLAAESHVDRSIDGPDEFIQTNVVGTQALLDRTLNYWSNLAEDDQRQFRFLHVSTDEVYGSLGDEGLFTEESPYRPNSPYSASKAASDHLVRAYQHTYGLPTLITNCSNNYGPYQFPEKLIPLMIRNAMRRKPLPVYGDGKNVRDWLYVEDHCRGIVRVLERGRVGECYNIGGNCERTNLEVVRSICATVDRLCGVDESSPREELIEFVKDRPGHDRRYAIDASKLQNELGWQPKENFESGLERTVRWYIDNEPWVNAVTSGSYDGERIGLATTDIPRR